MKRSALAIAVLAVLCLTAAVAASAGDGEDSGTVVSERSDLSLSLPPGWHASRARLVTKLLMPREVISVGNFGMVPGSGGNCGREPAAALRRMGPGDALVTVQEYRVTEKLRSEFRQMYPDEPELGRLTRLAGAFADGSPSVSPGGVTLYSATIPFFDHGRGFDALVYFRGRPGAEQRSAVAGILVSLRFGPDPVEFGHA